MASERNDMRYGSGEGDERRPTRRSTSRRASGSSSASSSRRSASSQRSSASRGSSSQQRRKSASSSGERRSQSSRPASASRSSQGSASSQRSSSRGSSSQQRRRSSSSASQRQRSSAARRGSTSRRPASGKGAARSSAARKQTAARRPSAPKLPAKQLAAVVVAVCLVLTLGLHHLLRWRIEVNGQKATVWRGATIEKLVEKGLATPTPGNLLAVDGSLLAKGEGHLCSATIDGEKVDETAKVHRGAVVTIEDGKNKTEKHTTSEEAIPYGTVNDSREFEAYWFGSIHLLSDGQEGVKTTKTGKVSGKTVSEVTTPALDAGYRIYTAKPQDKVVALTFDDGPWPETTNQILDILEENGAKATFFTIGSQIAETPDAVKRADAMGCQVCTHSWDHAAGAGEGVNLTYLSASEQVNEIQKGYQAIADVLGKEPAHVFRAPGGNFYGEIIDNLWPYVDAEIGWDVDTEDWRQPGSDAIAEMILSVQSGQVILMHDGGGDRSQTVEALRTALPQLVSQGYSFVTIDELLAYGVPGSGAGDGVVSVG